MPTLMDLANKAKLENATKDGEVQAALDAKMVRQREVGLPAGMVTEVPGEKIYSGEEAQYARIAKYLAANVAQRDIAIAEGLTDGRISQLLDDPGYQRVQQEVFSSMAAKALSVDEGWDDIERVALKNLGEAMKYSRDPDLNLRVAAIANKAVRHVTRRGNQVVNAPTAGRAQLTLSTKMIEKLNGVNGSAERGQEQQLQITGEASDLSTFVKSLVGDRDNAQLTNNLMQLLPGD
jgi:hypothetical protein